MTNEAAIGDCFRIGEVWMSPRGMLWKVTGFERSSDNPKRKAILKQGAHGNGRKVYRDWDAVIGWVRSPYWSDAVSLKLFAREVLDFTWQGSIDGDDVQKIALKYGLIVDSIATEEDLSDFFEGEPGDHIYRFTEVLSLEASALMSIEEAQRADTADPLARQEPDTK